MKIASFLFCLFLTTAVCADKELSPLVRVVSIGCNVVALGALGREIVGSNGGIIAGVACEGVLEGVIRDRQKKKLLSAEQGDTIRVANQVIGLVLLIVAYEISKSKAY